MGGADLAQARSYVGLDVHASGIAAVVLDAESGELGSFRLPGCPAGAASFCAGLPGPVGVVYEAGPTGFGLARELAGRGLECVVAAPGKIPRAVGERVKTDRRDAEQLARLLLAGGLCPVQVPGEREEALRDLVRAREVVRVDLMRARHRLSQEKHRGSKQRARPGGRPRPWPSREGIRVIPKGGRSAPGDPTTPAVRPRPPPRNLVLRPPGSAHISLTARRAARRRSGRPPSRTAADPKGGTAPRPPPRHHPPYQGGESRHRPG